MKTSKKLLAAFNESIERGKKEEVGSMDSFEVNKKNVFRDKNRTE